MNPFTIILFLVIAVGLVLSLRRVYIRQTEAKYYAGLARSVQVTSDAFEEGEDIPAALTCERESKSPPLQWTTSPTGVKSWALLVTDDDLPTARFRLFQIVHWVLYNIPRDVTGLASGITDEELIKLGIQVGLNWSREPCYYPPCPAPGTGRHRYAFRLYALDIDVIQPETKTRGGVMKAMEGHILAYGELNGFCEK